jgi:hypothetical protein
VERVSILLARHCIEHAVIGAAALAAHGVVRATLDLDLLAVDPSCLDPSIWQELRSSGVQVEVRRGDETDPLGGVVRVASADEQTIDLIVGKHAWQRDLLERSTPMRMGAAALRVVRAADLILLKLYAGGRQDAWDVDQLLDVDPALAAEVEERLAALPQECGELWRRIRSRRGDPR